MIYYKHFIGDYDAATAHLSWLEDCAYRRLVSVYYKTEQPIPADLKQVARLVRAASKAERDAVQQVLREFFTLEADGWHHGRCDDEIEAAHKKAGTNRSNGKLGGRPKRNVTQTEPNGNPDGSQTEPKENPISDLRSQDLRVLPTSPPESRSPPVPAQASARELVGNGTVSRETNSPRVDDLVVPAASREAMEEWRQHRAAKGRPLAPHELIVLGKTLASWGKPDVQLATVRHCIANGWLNLRQSDGAPVRSAATNAAAEAGRQAWEALIASDGAKRDARAQRALEAVGGWLAVKARNDFNTTRLRDEFVRAYASATEAAA